MSKLGRYAATHCNTLQHTATYDLRTDALISTLQRTATHCNTLQHAATRCNTLLHSADALDNPDSYDFIFECSQLGPGWWVGVGDVKITVDPEIAYNDFRELVTNKFGTAVLMSYVNGKGKVLPLMSEDDFNSVCDQIEDEWSVVVYMCAVTSVMCVRGLLLFICVL